MEISPLGEGIVKVTLAGRLDTQGVERIETRMTASLVPRGVNAIVDLSQVDFVASMGIRLLIATARSLKGRQARLVLFGTQAPVAEVLTAVALHQIIPICQTEADALSAVGAPQA